MVMSLFYLNIHKNSGKIERFPSDFMFELTLKFGDCHPLILINL